LRHVVRIAGVADEPQGDGVDARCMAIEQQGERRLVTA